MRRCLTFVGVLFALGLSGPPALAADSPSYEEARQAFHDFEKDPRKRAYRHHWERVIRAFEHARDKSADNMTSAAKARYMLGELYAGMFDVSKLGDDREKAIEAYRACAKHHPKVSLADDALYKAATLAKKAGDDGLAATLIAQLLRAYPQGDMRPGARQLQRTLSVAVRSVPKPQAPLIVLDPGHGGKDVGAKTTRGAQEKVVALAIAERTKKHLERAGFRVKLTRTSDTYISLERRTQMANTWDADAFVSIHANANKHKSVRGIETFYLDTSSDGYSRHLAHVENNTGNGHSDALERILTDLTNKRHVGESRALAKSVQRRVVQEITRTKQSTKDRGVKSALFYVLTGARMPAILVEAGFLTHRQEARLLSTARHQEAVASGIATALKSHFSEQTTQLLAVR